MTMKIPSTNASRRPAAPFGYRWHNNHLIIDDQEASACRLIFELFVRHQRKKTVARMVSEAGHRTRRGTSFSDTAVERILSDRSVTGLLRIGSKEMPIDPIVTEEMWKYAEAILRKSRSRSAVNIFAGIAECHCGGGMKVPSNRSKYVCDKCNHKISTVDLEDIFTAKIGDFLASVLYEPLSFADLTSNELRQVVEHICSRVVVGRDSIEIYTLVSPDSFKAVLSEGQQSSTSNRPGLDERESLSIETEPLLSEVEAAEFLGVSKMTVIRKRKAGELGFYRVGFRVLYSKTNHLQPFLRQEISDK